MNKCPNRGKFANKSVQSRAQNIYVYLDFHNLRESKLQYLIIRKSLKVVKKNTHFEINLEPVTFRPFNEA